MFPFLFLQSHASDDNNMAMALPNIHYPFKFWGRRGKDPKLSIPGFRQFVLANRLDEVRATITVRLSLTKVKMKSGGFIINCLDGGRGRRLKGGGTGSRLSLRALKARQEDLASRLIRWKNSIAGSHTWESVYSLQEGMQVTDHEILNY